MPEPLVLVLRAAGTNCNAETAHACEKVGMRARQLHLNRLLERPQLLDEAQMLAIPGGFSYGDEIAAGRVLGAELGHTLSEPIQALVARGGLVLGICNGFQALVQSGLLPGRVADTPARSASLSWNLSRRYEDRWVRLAVDPRRSLFAPRNGEPIELPVAHAEGRLVLADDQTSQRFLDHGYAPFRYLDEADEPAGAEAYPANPNGAEAGIAALCDKTGQILGLMPHPERALEAWHHPRWTRELARDAGEGLRLFEAAARALA